MFIYFINLTVKRGNALQIAQNHAKLKKMYVNTCRNTYGNAW